MSVQRKQWRCSHCGAWVDDAHMTHLHYVPQEFSWYRAGLDVPTSDIAELVVVNRLPSDPTRPGQ